MIHPLRKHGLVMRYITGSGLKSPIINNGQLRDLIKSEYGLENIRSISGFLRNKGAFSFPALKTGLYSAAVLNTEKDYTGYSSVWVRDNIFIAFAHYIDGQPMRATRVLSALMSYFKKYRQRFLDVISSSVDPKNPMNRPHVRFDGNNLEELPEHWPHAQNDALGYFLWLYCKLAIEHLLKPVSEDIETLGLFVRFFRAIRYWEDEDSGHWEETRKISASSIGVVVAALQQARKLLPTSFSPTTFYDKDKTFDAESVGELIAPGMSALEKILPEECIQSDPQKKRRVDSALLFLIYPLHLVKEEIASQILQNVIDNLQGDYGVRRYLGDSYWAPDYKEKLPPDKRTIDFSDNMSSRDSLLPAKTLEAQWCIFDPILSCIFGNRFQTTHQKDDLDRQAFHLNRALGQITSEGLQLEIPAFRCPELYYLRRGKYVPNDHVPLLWAQANLIVALKIMEQSCSLAVC
jgi:hypothetical protein